MFVSITLERVRPTRKDRRGTSRCNSTSGGI